MVTRFSKFSKSVSRQKKERRSFFENTIAGVVFIVFFVGIIGFLAFQNIAIGNKRTELESQLQTLQAQAGGLSNRQQELQEGIESVETEEYQEKLLREQGLYKKQGEEVVTVLPAKEQEFRGDSGEEEEKAWWNPFTW